MSIAILVVLFWSFDGTIFHEEQMQKFENPYHTWQGAMVTCEIVKQRMLKDTRLPLPSGAEVFCIDGRYYHGD